ncbi:MAG: hypothetical protein WD834_05190 [Actinomycetota bacterium]
MRLRFDTDLLDPEDPFELDMGNIPHLFKHGYTPDDAYDVYYGLPLYYEGDEDDPADWLMTGLVPGDILTVPLASPNSGDPRKARPIAIFRTGRLDAAKYSSDLEGGDGGDAP